MKKEEKRKATKVKKRKKVEPIVRERKINRKLWRDVKKKLKGSKSEKLDAIEVLIKDQYSLPIKSIELLKKQALPENPVEIRQSIVQQFEKFKLVPFISYFELIEVLRKDPERSVRDKANQLYKEDIEPKIKNWEIFLSNLAYCIDLPKKLAEAFRYPFLEIEKIYPSILDVQRAIANIYTSIPRIEHSLANLFSAQMYASLLHDAIANYQNQFLTLRFLNYYPLPDLQVLTQPYEVSEESPSFQLIQRLKECPPGKKHWQYYQDTCKDILTYTLVPPLLEPLEQEETEGGTQRRDLIFHIPHDVEGFWKWITSTFSSLAIIVECKNFSGELPSNDVVITSKYFGQKRLGLFGIIVTRIGLDESGKTEQKRLWIEDDNKMIICLNDRDLIKMIELKDQDEDPSKVIDEAIRSFRQSLA